MRYDGTDRHTIVKVVGKIWFPQPPEKGEGAAADDVRLSPDGNWALAQVSTQLYLLAVPHMGGEAPTVDISKSPLPLSKLTDIGADFMGWSSDSKTVTWAVGSTFFRLPLDKVVFEKPKSPEEKEKQKESAPKTEPGSETAKSKQSRKGSSESTSSSDTESA